MSENMPEPEDLYFSDGSVNPKYARELTPEEQAEYDRKQAEEMRLAGKRPRPQPKPPTIFTPPTEGDAANPIYRPELAPRPELKESRFRKFETALGQAMLQYQTIVDPMPMGLSPTTFISQIRDARLSYIRYEWPSKKLEPRMSLDLKCLKFYEQRDGNVLIENPKRKNAPSNVYTVADHKPQIELTCKGISSNHPQFTQHEYYIRFSTPDEEAWILALDQRYQITLEHHSADTYMLHF